MRTLLIMLLVVCAYIQTNAAIRYVKPIATGVANGSSWADASSDLQGMINASSSGDTVWVTAGVYKPALDRTGNPSPSNPRDKTFCMKTGVNIFGSFAGNETNVSSRNIAANQSILDGDIGVTNNISDNSYHVVLAIISNGLLDGFTVRNGAANYGSANERDYGGGIYTSGSNNIFRNLRVNNNMAGFHGGGIYTNGTNIITNDSVHNNWAGNGGGIAGTATIDSCIIHSNAASVEGGGVHVSGGTFPYIIANCLVYNNTASGSGAGLSISIANAIIANNIIFNNSTNTYWGGGLIVSNINTTVKSNIFYNNVAYSGGAVFNFDEDVKYVNNVFWGNISLDNSTSGNFGGGGIRIFDGNPIFQNNIFWLNKKNNSTTAPGADITGGLDQNFDNNMLQRPASAYGINPGATDNLFELDPLFLNIANPLGVDGIPRTADDGFSLTSCSPAINRGGTPTNPIPVDIINNPRIGSYDIGAYEFQNTPMVYSIPAPIGGGGSACSASPTTYTNSVPGGTWSSSTPTIASIATTGIATWLAGGTAVINYTMGNTGCPAATASKTVTVATPIIMAPITGIDSLCVNQLSVLQNTVTGGYWISSNTSVSTVDLLHGIVVGQSGGTTTITYYKNNGCYNAVTKDIKVNEVVVAAITGGTTACIGSTLQLANTTPNGTWTSSQGARATVNSTGLVTPVSAGTTTISYKVISAGCSTTVTKNITVADAPVVTATTGADSLCANLTTQFSNTTPNGVWASTTPSIASVSTGGVVTGLGAGLATITYTVTNTSGCATTVSKDIYIKPLPVVSAITGASAVCLNSTAQYTNITPGGTWSTLSNGAVAGITTTGLLTANATGSETIKYTVTNNYSCTSTANLGVTVNAPQLDPIVGVDSLCLGVNAQFTQVTSGGTWTNFNIAAGSINNSGFYTSAAAGIDTLYYQYTSNGCPAQVKKAIVVKALPILPIITGSNALCKGTTLILTPSATGGTWMSSTTSFATVSTTGWVSGIAVGTAVITYTVTNHLNCSISATHQVTVNPLPGPVTVNGANTVCKDAKLQLTPSITGGAFLSLNNNIASVDNNGLVLGVGAGTTTIKYGLTDANSCTDTFTHSITVNEVTVTSSQNGADLSANSSQSGVTYQWVDCNNYQPIAGATNINYTATANGQYAVIANYLGCSDTSQCHTVTGVGIKDVYNDQYQVSIIPNPTSDYVTINTGTKTLNSITISDMHGKTIRRISSGKEVTTINIQDLAEGMYHLHLDLGSMIIVRKLVIL